MTELTGLTVAEPVGVERVTELTGLTVAEPVGVESDRTNWTNSGRACEGRE